MTAAWQYKVVKRETLRFADDGSIVMVYDGDDGTYRAPDQYDMDNLDVGPDLTPEELELLAAE